MILSQRISFFSDFILILDERRLHNFKLNDEADKLLCDEVQHSLIEAIELLFDEVIKIHIDEYTNNFLLL